MEIFSSVVTSILKQLAKTRIEIKIIIYSGIEERKLGRTIYPFQIYYLTHIQRANILRTNQNKSIKNIENFDIEEYILINYIDVFWEAKKFQDYKCWTDGRIWVVTDLVSQSSILSEKEGNWDILLDPKNYPSKL